jgi:hypothetical protein
LVYTILSFTIKTRKITEATVILAVEGIQRNEFFTLSQKLSTASGDFDI